MTQGPPERPGADGPGVSGQEGQPPRADGWGHPPVPAARPAPRWGQYAPQPSPGASPQPGQPRPGQYGQYGQPQDGQWGAAPPGAYPPVPQAPRPGIIPLRPLGLGELLDGAFRAIRSNPQVMFGLSAVVVTITALIQLALTWSVFTDLESFMIASSAGASDIAMEDAFADLLGQLSVAMGAQTISAVVTTLLAGLLIISVSQSVLGRRASLGDVWASARSQILRLLGLTVLVLLIVIAPLVPWAALLFASLAQEQWGAAVAVGLLGGFAALAAVLYLVTKTVLATPALMLERGGVPAALRRGWTLTSGVFWRVLGIYLLTSLLVSVVAAAISGTTSIFFQVAAGGDPGVVFTPGYLVATTIAQVVATALTTPFTAAVVALLYIDVRMRKEGLDLELARAAERRS